jgi:hypothetical protein
MSEPEDFLSRWSRRKREASEAQDQPEAQKSDEAVEAESPAAGETGEGAPVARAEPTEETPLPFDISKLPSIDSITAETDIRPFLAAGVPAHLTQAALRRVWSADPKIRDFIEIAENQWDFASGAVPGFDLSPPTNVEEMVADIFGKAKKVVENADLLPDETRETSAPPQSSVSLTPATPERPDSASELDEQGREADSPESGDKIAQDQAAPQQDKNSETEIPVLPRRHGSALPS